MSLCTKRGSNRHISLLYSALLHTVTIFTLDHCYSTLIAIITIITIFTQCLLFSKGLHAYHFYRTQVYTWGLIYGSGSF